MPINDDLSQDVPGDTSSTTDIFIDDPVLGQIVPGTDEDHYRIELVAGTTYVIDLEGADTGAGTLSDPYLEIYDAAGNLLAVNNDGGDGFNSRFISTPPASGTYFVAVGSVGSSSGTYTLLVGEGDGVVGGLQQLVLDIDTTEFFSPQVVGNNLQIYSDIEAGFDEDTYVIDVVGGEAYTIGFDANDLLADPLVDGAADLFFLDDPSLSAHTLEAALPGIDSGVFDEAFVLDSPFLGDGPFDFVPDSDGVLLFNVLSFGAPGGYVLTIDGPGNAGSGGGGGPTGTEAGGIADPFDPSLESDVDLIPDFSSNFTILPNFGAQASVNSPSDEDAFVLDVDADETYVISVVGIGDMPLNQASIGELVLPGNPSAGQGFSAGPGIAQNILQYEQPDTAQYFVSESNSIPERGGNGGDYRVSVLQAETLENGVDSIGGDAASATPMQIGEAVVGGLQTAQDEDFFRLTAPADTFLFLTLAPNGFDDPLIGHTVSAYLEGEGGGPLELLNGRGTTSNNEVLMLLPSFGDRDLIIEVDNGFGPAPTNTGQYTLAAVQVFDTVGGSVDSTGGLTVGVPRYDVIEGPADEDWYRVSLETGESYTLTVDANTFSGVETPDIEVYDVQGNLLAAYPHSDFEAQSQSTEGEFIAPGAGDYFIAVSQGDSQAVFEPGGEYLLTVEGAASNTQQLAVTSGFDISEGETGQFTLSRTGAVDNILTVNFNLEGVGANPAGAADIAGALPRPGTVVFGSGQVTATVPVEALLDADDTESSETLRLQITGASADDGSDVTLGDTSATGTILGNDHVVSAGSSIATIEGNSGTTNISFTVERAGTLNDVLRVDFEVMGSGANPADADDFSSIFPTSGTLVFPDGEASLNVDLQITGDFLVEPDESFELVLSDVVADDGAPATITDDRATGTITNDDSPPVIQPLNGSVTEGADGALSPLVFGFTRGGSLGDTITVDYRIDGVSAGSADIQGGLPIFDTLVFGPNETSKEITLLVIDDVVAEPDETLELTITDASSDLGNEVALLSSGVSTGTIFNDDEPTIISVSAAADSVLEGGGGNFFIPPGVTPPSVLGGLGFSQTAPGSLEYIVSRTGDTDTEVTVDFSLIEGVTTARDYSFAEYRQFQTRGLFFLQTFSTQTATTATTLSEQLANGNDPFVQSMLIDSGFSFPEPQTINDLAGITIGESVDETLFTFSNDVSFPLPGFLTGGVVDADVVFDLSGGLGITGEALSLGEINLVSRLQSTLDLPTFVIPGESFDIAIDDSFFLTQDIFSETLSFGDLALNLDLSSDAIGFQDVSFGLAGLNLVDAPDLTFGFDLDDITLFEISAVQEVTQEIIDGFNLTFSLPDGESSNARSFLSAFAPAIGQASDRLFGANFSLFELLSNIPALAFLDVLTEDENFEFSFLGKDYNLEASFTLLNLMASVGLDFVQTFTFTPSATASVTVNGVDLDGEIGDSFQFSAPGNAANALSGQLTYEFGGELAVSYGLQPVAGAGIEVLSGGLVLTGDDAASSYSVPLGPLISGALSIDLGPRADLLTLDAIPIDSALFEPFVYDFDIPVRVTEPLPDAIIAGSLTFEPGETEKIVSFDVLADRFPEANQEIIFRVDAATILQGGVVEVANDMAGVTVIDDDNTLRMRFFFREADAWGDPHLVTLDGLGYDFQAVGEFTLVEAVSGDPLAIQLRTAPLPGSDIASQSVAMATLLGDVPLMIDVARAVPLLIDGVPTEVPAAPGFVDVGDGRVFFDGATYTIRYANGEEVKVGMFDGFLNVCVFLSPDRADGSVRGLLGNADGDTSNDLALPDGTVLEQPVSFARLYSEYADAWRVSDGDGGNSLFFYESGESTAGFTDPSFPRASLSLEDFPADIVAAAEARVDAAGIEDDILRANAIYDFIVTGEEEFIEAAAGVAATPIASLESDGSDAPVSLLGIFGLTPEVEEGDAGMADLVFQVYRTGDLSAPQLFELELAGDLSESDFVDTIPTEIEIPTGESAVELRLQVLADTVPEPDADIVVHIAPQDPPEGALVTTASALIELLDDDRPDLPTLSVNRVGDDDNEGTGSPSVVTFSVTLDEVSATEVTGVLALAASSAGATATPDDFAAGQALLIPVSIAPGDTEQLIEVMIDGDQGREEDEAFVARLTSISGAVLGAGEAAAVILNDDDNDPPEGEDLDLGLISERSDPLLVDLLSGVVDPEGTALTVVDLLVHDSAGDPVTVDFDEIGGTATLDPVQFAERLGAGGSERVTFSFVVVDAGGARLARQATLDVVGEAGPFDFFADGDGDGFGNVDQLVREYALLDGLAAVAGDANDGDGTVYPGAPEINDGQDNDQDGLIDEDNQLPDAVDDGDPETAGFTTNAETPFTTASVLANDDDPDAGDILSIVDIDTTAVAGLILHNGDGTFDYDPNGAFLALAGGATATELLEYTVSDGFGGFDSAVVTLTITGLNDLPGFTSPESFSLEENTLALGNASAQDPDQGDQLIFSVAGGDDGALFSVDANSGALRFLDAPDFENPADSDGNNSYQVSLGVSDGTETVTQDITVTVTDVEEGGGPGGPNIIQGTPGNDRLLGTPGDDLLISGGGRLDVLKGFGGADTFNFSALANGAREVGVVLDYTPGEDFVDLNGREVAFAPTFWGATYLFLEGGDWDILLLVGVTSVDQIDFVA